MFPDRHGMFEIVDETATCGEGLGTMWTRHRDNDSDITHDEVANPMHRRKRADGEIGAYLFGNAAKFVAGGGMGGIREPRHLSPVIDIAHGTHEQRDSARRGVAYRREGLIDR